MNKCKECGDDQSYHDWAQKPYCSPWCKEGRPGMDESPLHGQWTRSTRTDAIGREADFLQPLKGDGTINPHFVEKHGTKAIRKELKITERQIRENIERPRSTARELAAENNG